ncbi:hypothetical protein Ctob_008301 [Chrysochromulina tobinii]|uniref:Uncharacterized protein n=1 Tax=Chrysochromulina tobinii TaxID=1460289 RepID=A0A0M0J7Z0_9EUKA|nr:hypothetical protein Ctob_008301 [Chrysochromulina tobinii]|eukprot:KOO22716.1 hypothetical protein Ctob_008301 [Chrysochromulina sp. CCMP291]
MRGRLPLQGADGARGEMHLDVRREVPQALGPRRTALWRAVDGGAAGAAGADERNGEVAKSHSRQLRRAEMASPIGEIRTRISLRPAYGCGCELARKRHAFRGN